MIKDDVFYGNILGLLKQGKFNLSATEAIALVQIVQELERRRTPPPVPLIQEVKDPLNKIKKVK